MNNCACDIDSIKDIQSKAINTNESTLKIIKKVIEDGKLLWNI